MCMWNISPTVYSLQFERAMERKKRKQIGQLREHLYFLFYIKVLVTDNDKGMTFGEVKHVWRSLWSKGYFLHFLYYLYFLSFGSPSIGSILHCIFCWCTHKICLLLCLQFSDAQRRREAERRVMSGRTGPALSTIGSNNLREGISQKHVTHKPPPVSK